MNYALILLASIAIMASGWFHNSSLFDNFVSSETENATSFANTDHTLVEKLEAHAMGSVTVRFVTQQNSNEFISKTNWDFVHSYTANSAEAIKNTLLYSPYNGLEMIPIAHGRQGQCFIQLDPRHLLNDLGRDIELNDLTSNSPPLIRASAYHELEHCLMPQWMISKAVDFLIENNGMPSVKDEVKFRKVYERTLAEIYADSYAMIFMPEPPDVAMALFQFREQESLAGRQHGPYTFNYRVLKDLHTDFTGRTLTNNEYNRSLLLSYLTHSPSLPTPAEIKAEFQL